MMKNITRDFLTAIDQEVLWSVNEFFLINEKLKDNAYGVSWEEGENWAGIIRDDKLIGFLWKKYPVLLFHDFYSRELRAYLGVYKYIGFIEVGDLVSEELKLDDNELLNDRLGFKSDTPSFSATDLWLSTVTK